VRFFLAMFMTSGNLTNFFNPIVQYFSGSKRKYCAPVLKKNMIPVLKKSGSKKTSLYQNLFQKFIFGNSVIPKFCITCFGNSVIPYHPVRIRITWFGPVSYCSAIATRIKINQGVLPREMSQVKLDQYYNQHLIKGGRQFDRI